MQKVIMISRDPKALEEGSAVFARIQEYRTLFDELDIVLIKRSVFSFLKAFISVSKLSRKIGKGNWITSQDPFEAGVVAFVVAKIFRQKLQLQLHTDVFGHFYSRLSVGNFVRMSVAKFLIPKADSLRVVSQRIKDQIVEKNLLPIERIFVLPVFVDTKSIATDQQLNLKEKYPEFEKIVLIVARLEKEKNIDLAMEAFAKVLRKLPRTGLVLAGNGSEDRWLHKLADHLDIAKNVRFEGWLDDPIAAYKSADLLLVTSFYEGYGMNIVEALSCGCPVVSTDVGIAEEAGAAIVDYDPGAIALISIDILEKGIKGELAPDFANLSKQEYLDKYKQTFL